MWARPVMFKNYIDFTPNEFQYLCVDTCPIITKSSTRTIGEESTHMRRPYKLNPEQQLLVFLLFMKHNSTSNFEAFEQNESKCWMHEKMLKWWCHFHVLCINWAIFHETERYDQYEREVLGQMLPGLEGAIGDTLLKIKQPYKDPNHSRWFNDMIHITLSNNINIVDNNGLLVLDNMVYIMMSLVWGTRGLTRIGLTTSPTWMTTLKWSYVIPAM